MPLPLLPGSRSTTRTLASHHFPALHTLLHLLPCILACLALVPRSIPLVQSRYSCCCCCRCCGSIQPCLPTCTLQLLPCRPTAAAAAAAAAVAAVAPDHWQHCRRFHSLPVGMDRPAAAPPRCIRSSTHIRTSDCKSLPSPGPSTAAARHSTAAPCSPIRSSTSPRCRCRCGAHSCRNKCSDLLVLAMYHSHTWPLVLPQTC